MFFSRFLKEAFPRKGLFLLLPLLFFSCSSIPPKASPGHEVLPPPSLEELLLPREAPSFPRPTSRLLPAETLGILLSERSFQTPSTLEAWKGAWRKVKDLGEKGGPVLVRILTEGPPQSRMAAATLLGCLSPRSLLPLCRALDDPDPEVGAAAAFALGDLGDGRALPRLLLEVLPAPSPRAPVVRAAAASSLYELGSTSGIPFLLGLLQAGTPGNGPRARAFHLPEKDRWALEKEIGLRVLRRLSGKRFGLEPEQGWADLKKGAAAWSAWWKAEGKRKKKPLGRKARKALEEALLRVRKALPLLGGEERIRAEEWQKAARRALGEGVE